MKKLFFGLCCFFSLNLLAEPRWDGSYYAVNSGMQQQFALEALKMFPIAPTDAVLDIGCGNGLITKHISTLVPGGYVIGLDKSPSMIDTAKQYQTDKLSFVLGDAYFLPYSNKFNRIVSFNALHWVPDIRMCIRGIRDALVPGGKMLILMAPLQPRSPLHDVMIRTAYSDTWKSYFSKSAPVYTRYSFAEWAHFIESEGLIPERIQLIDTSLDYPSKKAYCSWLQGWIPFGTIPDDKKEAYVQDIVDAYVKIVPLKADGTARFVFDELIVIASKPL
jgi:trans-aconitate 2-methyltransferase